MKFLADGPDIHDHLLWERDAGNVVFICGAGVSMERAKLPSFLELALKLMDRFNVLPDSEARKIYNLASEGETKEFVQIDKIFGHLEIDSDPYLIEKEVAKLLSRKRRDISCHNTIRELATTPANEIRLITTNFDNLFSRSLKSSDVNYQEWVCPNLPNLEQSKELKGLIYLHGKCENIIQESNTLVLSPRMFGKAYLSEGWATKFLKSVFERHTVVFVGYSADDPLMQYLLESIDKQKNSSKKIYAFQEMDMKKARKKWKKRGINPIYFKNYESLWKTLEVWAQRAQDPKLWMGQLLKSAIAGPEKMKAWQRSQVMHLALHPVGAEAIASQDPPISPKWLFCFDSKFRIPDINNSIFPSERKKYTDIYDQYRLAEDSKEIPELKEKPSDQTPSRETPDAFMILSIDIDYAKSYRHISLLGLHSFECLTRLPRRISMLSVWISNISRSPVTVRWISHQKRIHPDIKWLIESRLYRQEYGVSKIILNTWDILFEAFENDSLDSSTMMYNLEKKIRKDGWSDSRVWQYRKALEPRIAIERLETIDEIYRSIKPSRRLRHVISYKVVYPDKLKMVEIPDKLLPKILKADKINLDQAIEFEKRLGKYRFWNLPPMSKLDSGLSIDYARYFGKNSLVFGYFYRLKRLSEISRASATEELKTWPKNDYRIYARLTIWVIMDTDLINDLDAGMFLLSLPKKVFWNEPTQPDLLRALRLRWSNFSDSTHRAVEKKILEGDTRWPKEEDSSYQNRKAWQSLNMLQWLKNNHCNFTFDVSAEMKSLLRNCPEWLPEDADRADRSYEPSDVEVRVYNGPRGYDGQPIYESSIRHQDNLTEIIPSKEELEQFRKFCEKSPVSAFSFLDGMSSEGVYPRWAWEVWLCLEGKEESQGRYLSSTTELLCNSTHDHIIGLKNSVFPWFREVSKIYSESQYDFQNKMFNHLFTSLSKVSKLDAPKAGYEVDERPDWDSKFPNSSAGNLSESLFIHTQKSRLLKNSSLIPNWLRDVKNLLTLEGDDRRYVLISFVFNLLFLYNIEPDFTVKNIISESKGNDIRTRRAFWYALSKAPSQISHPDLFMHIKDELIRVIGSNEFRDDSLYEGLSLLCVRGWLNRRNGKRLISGREFSEALNLSDESFRLGVLWRLQHWLTEENDDEEIDKYKEIGIFLKSVWPLTRDANSEKINLVVLRIIFFDLNIFSRVANSVMPRLGKMNRFDDIILDELLDKNQEIIDRKAKIVLRILYRTLPDDLYECRSKVCKILSKISDAAPHLTKDGEYINFIFRCR